MCKWLVHEDYVWTEQENVWGHNAGTDFAINMNLGKVVYWYVLHNL